MKNNIQQRFWENQLETNKLLVILSSFFKSYAFCIFGIAFLILILEIFDFRLPFTETIINIVLVSVVIFTFLGLIYNNIIIPIKIDRRIKKLNQYKNTQTRINIFFALVGLSTIFLFLLYYWK